MRIRNHRDHLLILQIPTVASILVSGGPGWELELCNLNSHSGLLWYRWFKVYTLRLLCSITTAEADTNTLPPFLHLSKSCSFPRFSSSTSSRQNVATKTETTMSRGNGDFLSGRSGLNKHDQILDFVWNVFQTPILREL